LDGTARTVTARATARSTGAATAERRAAAAAAVVAGPVVLRLLVIGMLIAAAATRPRGLGSEAAVTSAAPVAIAVSIAPAARLRRGRDRSRGENRTGSSTIFTVARARSPLMAVIARFCPSPSAWPATAGPRTSSGQCHRYQEYDTFPPSCRGRRASTVAGPQRGAAQPAATTAAVPPTGSSAAVPGNGVDALKWVTDQTIVPRPSQPSAAAARLGSRPSRGAPSATTPPAASSHARAGSEKNAQGCDTAVSRSDSASEAAPKSRTMVMAVSGDVARDRRHANEATSSSSGQTM
jgi:hypothetical protein